MHPSQPLYKMSALLASSAAVKATPGRLMAVLVTAAAALCITTFQDHDDAGGTSILSVSAPIGGSTFVDLSPIGGIAFETTAIFATLAGTGGTCTCWFE